MVQFAKHCSGIISWLVGSVGGPDYFTFIVELSWKNVKPPKHFEMSRHVQIVCNLAVGRSMVCQWGKILKLSTNMVHCSHSRPL